MSVSTYRSNIERLTKQKADLEKKASQEYQKIAKLEREIAAMQQSIARSTSSSIVRSKQRQVESKRKQFGQAQEKAADLAARSASKLTELNRNVQNLERAEKQETRKRRDEELRHTKSLTREAQKQASLHSQISRSLLDDPLNKSGDTQLSTYNAPDHPPLDPEKAQSSFDVPSQTQPATDHLEDGTTNQALALEISALRDNLNAVFREKFGGPVLRLPQERGLSELSRPCNGREEFTYRVAALSGLATSIETGYIKTQVPPSGEGKGSLNLLGAFLRDRYPNQDVNLVMDTLVNLNRVRRMYPIHVDHAKGVATSLTFFGLDYPVQDYQAAWLTLLESYAKALRTMLAILKSAQ